MRLKHNLPLKEEQNKMEGDDETKGSDSSHNHWSRKNRLNGELLNYIRFGNTHLAMMAMQNGANPTFVDPRDGWSGIHYAASYGLMRIIRALLEAGVDINMRTADKETPLHKAARTNRRDMLRFLLKHGANADALSASGERAADLTTDGESKFLCESYDQYVQMDADARKAAVAKRVMNVNSDCTHLSGTKSRSASPRGRK